MAPTDSARTILYVGDESECRADFCAEFRIGAGAAAGEAVVIETAADGVEAMAWLNEKGSSGEVVIVLDFALPVLEAYGFLKGLRAEAGLAHLPAVLISTRAKDPRIAKLAVAALVERPVELRQLLDAVRGLLPGA
jgi:CheY-like chemotaxis protein